MKKIFFLIATVMLLAGCDDGDMGYKTFDFTNQSLQDCPDNKKPETTTDVYYKINGTEGLILTLPKTALINAPTLDPETNVDTPRLLTLGSTNVLTYYDFVSKPSSLCKESEMPAYNEMWTGQGTLSISTSEQKDNDGKLLGYKHYLTMINVSFSKDGETITVINSELGEIDKDFDFKFNFIKTGETKPKLEICTQSKLLYTRLDKELLSLNVIDFDAYFNNTVGEKIITLPNPNGEDQASVVFNVYNGAVSSNNACAQGSDVPSLPLQRWIMSGGTIVIKTTETGGVYSHDIYLKNALFVSFNQRDRFYLNDVIDVEEDGYFLGTY